MVDKVQGFVQKPDDLTVRDRQHKIARSVLDYVHIHESTADRGVERCKERETWLSDETLSVFVKLLRVRQRNRNSSAGGVTVIYDLSISQRCAGNVAALDGFLHGTFTHPIAQLDVGMKWEDVSSIVIPFNIGGMHWVLVHVVGATRSIHVYDSLRLNQQLVGEQFVRWATRWFMGQWTVRDPIQIPLQTDGYNCGVYVAMAIYDIAVDGTLPRNRNERTIDDCRGWMYDCLLGRRI